MANLLCRNPDCTFGETGKCVLGNPAPGCEHLQEVADPEAGTPGDADASEPDYDSFTNLYPGMELGVDELAELMRQRYVHIIGLLGLAESGKTCFASSLYLLLSSGALTPRYCFAESRTLPGFEARARKARRWSNGVLPGRLAQRTELSDPRSPAFLHLRMVGSHSEAPTDFAISDLPGEWAKGLSEKSSYVERHNFLRAADAAVLLIDGARLASREDANSELKRNELILRRISESDLLHPDTPVAICCSKADLPSAPQRERLAKLRERAVAFGMNAREFDVCAFSTEPSRVGNGSGVVEVLDFVLGTSFTATRWIPPDADRAFLGPRRRSE